MINTSNILMFENVWNYKAAKDFNLEGLLKVILCFHLCWSFLNMSVKCYNLSTEKRTKHPPAVLSPSNSIQSINVFSCHKYNLSSIKGNVNYVVKLNVQHLPHRPLSERGSGSCSEWARVKGDTACLNIVLFHFSTISFCSDCRKIDFKTRAIKQLAMKSVK